MNDKHQTVFSGELAELLRPVLGDECERCAELLLKRYLRVETVFSTDYEELCKIVGPRGAICIKLLARITSRRLTESFEFGKAHTECELTDYLKALFLGLSEEHLYVISLGDEAEVLGVDLVSVGTVNSAAIVPRNLVEIALKRKAKSIMLAHNHPGGRPEPSSDDNDMATSLVGTMDKAGVCLKAHIVIAGSRHFVTTMNTGG